MGEKSTKIFRPRRVEPSYENAKVWTKKLSDLLTPVTIPTWAARHIGIVFVKYGKI